MKNIYRLNLVVVGIPIVFSLFGLINTDFIFYALLSTMLTGFVQAIIGLKMLIDEPKDKKLQLYIKSVLIFFLLWFIIGNSNIISHEIDYLIAVIPILLAIFLTYIIYKKTKS
uniref:hypothetical protein n=1 Tax=Gelidibacter sp. TaxID=2018083 RepID=UPI00404A0A5D